jgi:uncharacterized protein YecE (DUF72 family)
MEFIGTAGWNLTKEFSEKFPEEGSHLVRYAQVFHAVEINSSFYREHMPKTYERWASVVPDEFRFSVKLSQEFTHKSDLRPKEKELRNSLDGVLHLGEKLGFILLQFPGSREFHPKNMERFLKLIRKSYAGPLALEARNCSWINHDGKILMRDFAVSKVIADPERCPGGPKSLLTAGGSPYYRLHGSPVIYRSSYPKKFLKALRTELQCFKNPWVIFDNTTFGKATENALQLQGLG